MNTKTEKLIALFPTLAKWIETFYSMKSGAVYKVTWQRPMRTRKDVQTLVEKRVVAPVRAGIEYDNQQRVIEARANGELPAENAGLSWGQWFDFKRTKTHTPKGETALRLYFNFATPDGDRWGIPSVEYFADGKPITKAEAETLCASSEFRDSITTTFDVRADYLKDFAIMLPKSLVPDSPNYENTAESFLTRD